MSGGFDSKPGQTTVTAPLAPAVPQPGKTMRTAPPLPRTSADLSTAPASVARYDDMLEAVQKAKQLADSSPPGDPKTTEQILRLIAPVERRLSELNDHQGCLAQFGAGNVAGQASLDMAEAAVRSWRQLLLLGGMVRTDEMVTRFTAGAEVIRFLTGEARDAPTLRGFHRASQVVGVGAAVPVLAPPLLALAAGEVPLLAFVARVSARHVALWAATEPAAALALSEVLVGFGLQIGEGGWEAFWSQLQAPKERWFVVAQVLMDFMHVSNSGRPRSYGSGQSDIDVDGARGRLARSRGVIREIHDAAETSSSARRPGMPRAEVSEAKTTSQDLFTEGADPAAIRGKRIKPGHLRRELMKSEVGKETLEIIKRDDIDVILSYNEPTLEKAGETLYGISGDGYAVIYVVRTQSKQRTAQTVIHEVTHNAGIHGSQRAEIIAEIRAAKHLGRVSSADIRKIILRIQKDYGALPYKILAPGEGTP